MHKCCGQNLKAHSREWDFEEEWFFDHSMCDVCEEMYRHPISNEEMEEQLEVNEMYYQDHLTLTQ